MRKLISISMFLALSSACFAKSAIGDWLDVQDIPNGWQIIVVTSFTYPCIFTKATDDELVCDAIQHERDDSRPREIHVRRERIHEIRVEKREGANMLAGAAGGGGLGAIMGALLFAGARGPGAYTFGLGGASMGARSGRGTHILRGKVIYRRPVLDKPETTTEHPTATEHSSTETTAQISR